MWIVDVIGGLAGLGKTWLEGKQKIQEAQINQQVTQINNDANWDNIQAEASKSSWKDEWLTILISVPMVLAFIPGADGIVEAGFKNLSECPEWYQYLIGVVFAASFGIKKVTDIFATRKR
ncbi:hypothetical protein [Pseudomonas phage K4]|uniref:Holin n=1 Tax=Pseudomonas phage TC6 TaxID=2060947 RepID=A0A2H5BQG1_9CAUD|nr:hypothetical protein ORF031 [Pseudomonas phage PA11]YP_009304501.1 hypothetical protein BJD45_gp22 [Pseudomonas phage O4]ATG86258.1 hypothetical protein [Pseudomonas phage IME180]AUG88532.1 hypothetical protein [Pseudomonas phage TC6]QVJ12734.1 hypothetical protein [Pseudomonas phage PSA11]QWS70005.1 hypothetical protein [Pseudomonas phage K4]UVN13515.1 hypothetical protein FBPa8_0051 [Pseudomonas phage vB_PaeP_FBPa8]WEU69474.1 hypothetical protein TY_54 [Pseudomonas phage vB_PaeM_Ty]